MTDTPKTEVTRSPRYPQFSLSDALDKIRTVYKKEDRHKVPKEAIVKSIGYTSINGASLGAIATLKQYGLLETVGDGLRVSDDAVTIIELPKGDSERADAIVRTAFNPKLFAELSDEYGEKPPSDESIRLNLIRKGYKKAAADVIIRTFRETLALVADERGGYNAGGSTAEAREPEGQPQMQPQPATQPVASTPAPVAAQSGAPADGFSFQISDKSVNVLFNGTVTQEAIRKLIKYLEISVDDFPTKAQIERPKAAPLPRPAPSPLASLFNDAPKDDDLEEAFGGSE